MYAIEQLTFCHASVIFSRYSTTMFQSISSPNLRVGGATLVAIAWFSILKAVITAAYYFVTFYKG
jgi:hypothetical protein